MKNTETHVHLIAAQYAAPRFATEAPVLKECALELIGTTPVSAVSHFSFIETFGKEKPAINVSCLGENFQYAMKDMVLQDVPASTVTSYNVTQAVKVSDVRAELRSKSAAKSSLEPFLHELLPYLWELLTKQPWGQSDGSLIVNGSWNVFMVRGNPIGVSWSDGHGWNVGIHSGELFKGSRVFSQTK